MYIQNVIKIMNGRKCRLTGLALLHTHIIVYIYIIVNNIEEVFNRFANEKKKKCESNNYY